MAKLKFYTDEHISKAVVKGLKTRGIDAESCVDLGMRTASDKEHLSFAKEERRVIVGLAGKWIQRDRLLIELLGKKLEKVFGLDHLH